MSRPKPLSFDADPPRDTDEDHVLYGFWRAWGRRRAVALANAVRRVRQLEHEVRLLRRRLAARSRALSISRQREAPAGTEGSTGGARAEANANMGDQ